MFSKSYFAIKLPSESRGNNLSLISALLLQNDFKSFLGGELYVKNGCCLGVLCFFSSKDVTNLSASLEFGGIELANLLRLYTLLLSSLIDFDSSE